LPARPVDPEQREAALAQRGAVLARVADELADQRLHLAEQAERLLLAHQTWCADRVAAMQDLEQLGARLPEREQELARRDDDLRKQQVRLRAEAEALAALGLRLEAQRARADVCAADRQAELDHLRSAQDLRERMLEGRESKLVNLYRLWGQRRWQEVQRLCREQEAYAQERAEWVAARTAWLQAAERLHEERTAVATHALALEQWQQKCQKPSAEPPATAAKRVERLQRQWATYCAGAARELQRLRATIAVEAARIDERSQQVRQEQGIAAEQSARLDERAVEVERDELRLKAERAVVEELVARERSARQMAEQRAAEMREEIERLARLLIDAPVETPRPLAA
jgi:hypothetical protein